MSDITIQKFSDFKGIYNNGSNPPPKGTYFSSAVNIDIDRNDIISMRSGYTRLLTGTSSSLFSTREGILGLYGNNLCIIRPTGTTLYATTLLQSVGDNYWVYSTVGDRTYATNGIRIGYVENAAWNNLPAVTDTYKANLPAGHVLSYYRARLYVANGSLIVYSDPAAYHMYDVRNDRNFIQLPTKIRMIAPTNSGIWLSDQESIYFMKGDSPTEFTIEKKASYPAIEGTASQLQFILYNEKFAHYNPSIFTSTKGICIGTDEGTLINLTEEEYSMPVAYRGTCLTRRGNLNQYISIIR